MSLFDRLGGGPTQTPQQMDPRQMQQQMQQDVSDIKAHPAAFLKSRGINIPDGMTNPQQIIQHLMQSGQVPANRYQAAMQMMQRMGRR